MNTRHENSQAHDAAAFSPQLIETQDEAPHPRARHVLYTLLCLLGLLGVWGIVGRLDVVVVAEGRLVPATRVKIVQPAEQGIVREILVREGQHVSTGQVLMRMDANLSDADRKVLQAELQTRELQVRRIDAELNGTDFPRKASDDHEAYARMEVLFRSRRATYQDQLGTERATLARAEQDMKSAIEVEGKLTKTGPILAEQARAWDQLAKEGYAGKLLAMDRERIRIENSQDLQAQRFAVEGLNATIDQARKRIAQITSGYRQQLAAERVEAESARQRVEQELAKQSHRQTLLELRAPQDGIVKDLATYTSGAVVSPGAVLLTVVPMEDPLRAEVWIKNDDIGFVRPEQVAKLKVQSFQFQKYGTLDGTVAHVGPDAADNGAQPASAEPTSRRPTNAAFAGYRALIDLKQSSMTYQGERLELAPGMQVLAEIRLGERTVIEYVLSPVRRAFLEAGRER